MDAFGSQMDLDFGAAVKRTIARPVMIAVFDRHLPGVLEPVALLLPGVFAARYPALVASSSVMNLPCFVAP